MDENKELKTDENVDDIYDEYANSDIVDEQGNVIDEEEIKKSVEYDKTSDDKNNEDEDIEVIDEDVESVEGDFDKISKPEKEKYIPSKSERALIEQKRLNKQLKDELKKVSEREQQGKLEEKKKHLTTQYEEKGYDESLAKELAEKDIRLENLERKFEYESYSRNAERLSNQYPDIFDNLDNLISLCKKTGWTLEKVCKAELTPSSDYDIKTKAEQLAFIKSTEARKKAIDVSQQSSQKPVQLTSEQKKLFDMWRNVPSNRGKSVKEFLEIDGFEFN